MLKLLKLVPFVGKWAFAAKEWKDVIDKGSEMHKKYVEDGSLPDDVKALLKEFKEAREASSKLF
jgi:hypothetical protein